MTILHSRVVEQVLVDLIGDHPHAVLECPLTDGRQLGGEYKRACRVRGRAQKKLCVKRAASSRSTVTLVLISTRENFHGVAPTELDDLRIGPVGVGGWPRLQRLRQRGETEKPPAFRR